jgi:hypothetical protein
MNEFLQTYGSWIIFGLLMLLMFRMHAGGHGGAHSGGHGCGMEPGEHPDHMSQHSDQRDDGAYQGKSTREKTRPTAIEIARAWPDTGETSRLADDHHASSTSSEEDSSLVATTAEQPHLQAGAKTISAQVVTNRANTES